MRYVFITGTSRGLGRALLGAFKEDRIISISRSEVDTAADLYKSHYVDLLDETALENKIPEIFDSISPEHGDEIYFINNAGTVNPVQSIENMDARGYLDNYKVNVLAPALFMKGFIHAFKDLRSIKRVLTVSSGAAVNPMEGWAAYCTSKASVNMLSGVMRLETGKFEYPIESATFRPGVIDTDMQETIRNSNPSEFPDIDKFKDYKSEERLLAPMDVASALKQVITSEGFSETAGYDVSEYM